MPINLNREAQVEWDKYLEASSIDDQIFHLERFLGVCVKHKGVEKHLAMAKTKLKKLKAQKAKLTLAKKGSGEKWLVPKGEDAQIAIVGGVNSGKSSVLNELARSEAAKVGSYPFTTVKPEVGSLTTNGARLQLVELPALIKGSVKGISGVTRRYLRGRKNLIYFLFFVRKYNLSAYVNFISQRRHIGIFAAIN